MSSLARCGHSAACTYHGAMDEGSSRRALAYVAAWLPFTAVWFLLIFQFGASPQTAAISAATHTLWAGSLSLLIWWRTGREPYPDPVNVFFLGRHAVYATLFGATIVSANILFFSAYEQIPVGKLLADQLPFIPWQMAFSRRFRSRAPPARRDPRSGSRRSSALPSSTSTDRDAAASPGVAASLRRNAG